MNAHSSLRPVLILALALVFVTACAAPAALPTVLPSASSGATIIAPPSSTPPLPTVPPLPPAASRVPGQVTGSVLIEQGRSAAGGVVDTTIQLEIDLSATSTAGKVSAMRVAPVFGCDQLGQVEGAPWEPFAPKKYLLVGIGLNWIGFYVAAQFQDDQGNLSPVYCDDISLEGMPAIPDVNPTDWYSHIQCFTEADVHPSHGETVQGPTVTFSWPNTNSLPDGVFYQVNAYSSADQYLGMAAQARTRDTSVTLSILPDKAGDIVWYIVLTDANGAFLDHARCSSFASSLLTVNPPTGIKGVHFTYKP
jgi:hypothetical protein